MNLAAIPSVDSYVQRVPRLVRVLLCGAALCGILVAMILDRAAILRGGAEVRLATEPVDPRDLFRGDYVVLSYAVSMVETPRGEPPKVGTPVFVRLKPGEGGRHVAAGLSFALPTLGPGEVAIAGKVRGSHECIANPGRPAPPCTPGARIVRVAYGIESYFVPEGEGRAIETTEASRVEVVAAVSASGRAAIKRLLIDGKPVHDEPPF